MWAPTFPHGLPIDLVKQVLFVMELKQEVKKRFFMKAAEIWMKKEMIKC